MGAQATITPGSFTKYQWQDQSSANSFTVNAPGTYWVKVTNNFNCSATDTFIVHSILPHPSNFLKNTDSICEYATLKIEPIKTFNQYVWSTGSSEKIIEINKPGKYLLKVTDQNGCAGTDSMTVFKKDCMLGVYIPTAFTPNNDGKNDYFKALVFGKVLSFKLEIFDRAGQIIFQTTDPDKVWDGGNKLDKYPTAVFVWQCSYHLDKQLPGYQKGTVTIIR
jgi:gliding motility-associated-like protein